MPENKKLQLRNGDNPPSTPSIPSKNMHYNSDINGGSNSETLDGPLATADDCQFGDVGIRMIPPAGYSFEAYSPSEITLHPRRHETERKKCRRIENRRIILKLKADGCWMCCRKDLLPTSLHFHHLDPKTKKGNIANLITRSTRALIDEIRKCRLICLGCHKTHHLIIESDTWRTGGCYDL